MKLFKSKNKPIESNIPANAHSCLLGDHVIKQGAGELAKQIRGLVSVTNDIYNELYLSTLHRFAEFCQNMPLNEAGDPYSLLIQQLKLCIAVLQIRRGLLLPQGASAETIAEQEPLWTFALFSTSLLYQIHKVQEDRQIFFYNAQGERIGLWHPISGSLYEPNTYFTIEWKSAEKIVNNTLMASLATRMIDAPIIRWLSQEYSLLDLWWNAITTYDSNNFFIKIIHEVLEKTTVNQVKQQNKKHILKDKAVITQNQTTNNVSSSASSEHSDDIEITSSFLIFLEHQYSQDENETNWLRVKHGLLVRSNIIDEFIKANKEVCADKNQFINLIKPSLVEEKNQCQFRFRPLDYGDRRIIEGIILKEEYLNELWKKIPINSEFKPAIN